MLQIFRNKAQSSFAILIVAIIILVFVFWGVGTNLLSDHQAALVVNGQDISFTDFQQAHNAASERMNKQFGGTMPKAMGEIVKNQVINELIRDVLIRQGASEMGIIVSDEEVRRLIETMPQFQKDGVFSLSLYKELLTANHLTPTQFEQRIEKERITQLTIKKVGDFATLAGDFEIEDIYSQINEKVAVEYAVFSSTDFTDKVVIDEKELTSWFEAEKERYKTEPQRNFRYITFLYDDIGKKLGIDQSKAEEYYRNHLDSFVVPEQRSAAHILIRTGEEESDKGLEEKRSKAEEIRQLALQDGQDFAELAKKYSEGPSADEGGDLGFFTRGQMVPAFDTAVFTMEEGAISDVIKTEFGYHIIHLDKIIPAQTKPFPEVQDQIVSTLRKKEAASVAFQLANSTYEGIITSGSLDTFAAEYPDANFQTSGLVTKSTAPADIAADSQFLQRSFALGDKELSSLIKGDSGYAIFYVEEGREPETPELATIRQQVEKDYRKSRAKELAQDAATRFLSQVKENGTDFADTARQAGIPLENSGLLGHNAAENKTSFPSSLLDSCFQLTKAAPIVEEPGIDGGSYYVSHLTEREIPRMPEDSPERPFYQANLQNIKQQQIFSAWLQHLWTGAKVRKHESL